MKRLQLPVALVLPIEFVVMSLPIAQPRQQHAIRGGRAINYLPDSHPVHGFKADCRKAARAAYSGPPLDGPLRLTATFVMTRPQSLRWKTKSMPRLPHTGKPDTDNLVKALCDALNKVLWDDDSRICEMLLLKVVAAGDEEPHVAVRVEEWREPARTIRRLEPMPYPVD